ncbi:hypothetical protein H257_09186 [Aphanomyces astaci]|uniref:Uncharacterized protein n=1 Tax=Aphanomyces astaci TaxID=112090 RepID=W4GBP8_APHAT|nr:hypothetical protein H257_09186 [Aphanomyces astaci]ETV76711.1 hypothetical protein H257_09186 [Aphanomyces astaci]|eukprot:XP_009833623.1 hypothetical protein H257_09186 [Aphanomyces astaci]
MVWRRRGIANVLYIGDVFNTQLSQSQSGAVALLNGGVYSTKSYALLLDIISLVSAVASLGLSSLDKRLPMGSAYCWLNTNRTFAMALTFKLQRRCGATKKYNAALYFAQLPGKQSGHGGAEPGDQRDDSDLVAVVHLLNDVFSGWTQELTAQYAYKSSVLTWFVLAIWSVLVPVQHAAHIHRECSIDAVDTALTCRNGRGGVASCALPSTASRFEMGNSNDNETNFPHCSTPPPSTSLTIYYVDRASSVLNGLLAIRTHRNTLVVLDIKTWRVFVIHLQHGNDANVHLPRTWSCAIPLVDNRGNGGGHYVRR